ncbi:MAG: hypothetical protein Q7K57_00060 [Burkholderiaceae bacterium]|nr:hypothetical protein [Burkholderiaceae bacterium]
MSDTNHPLPLERSQAGAPLAPALRDASAQAAMLRQHHRERLARLFRHAGESADDRYLLDLVTRYRGLDPS